MVEEEVKGTHWTIPPKKVPVESGIFHAYQMGGQPHLTRTFRVNQFFGAGYVFIE